MPAAIFEAQRESSLPMFVATKCYKPIDIVATKCYNNLVIENNNFKIQIGVEVGMSMIEALRTIAAVSKKYAGDATKAIRISSDTSRQIMFNTIAQSVLTDQEIELSNEERRLISSFISEDNEGGRDYTMRVRLNARERFVIENIANELEMTVSDLVRGIFLAIGERKDPADVAWGIMSIPSGLDQYIHVVDETGLEHTL